MPRTQTYDTRELCNLQGSMRTQTRCRVLPSGQVGSSSATRIANMWAMQRPRAMPAAAILPLKYGNVPNSGSCGAHQRCQASLSSGEPEGFLRPSAASAL